MRPHMLRLLAIIGLASAGQLAYAGDAGKIVFVAGAAQVGDVAGALGMAVHEGDLLSTGADGYIYVKTIDSGLFILRPSTKARIAVYHVDEKNPANSQFKLELLNGTARSRSGDAVKQARQNFRFNTPVAAIGVRGTDFTVFTDQNTSRVAVVSGAITVSGFVGACRPEGGGPCEGGAVRELSAAQKGQFLEIQRGKAAPQLLRGSALSPDTLAPPRPDEPIGKNSGGANANLTASGEPSLDPQKTVSLQDLAVVKVPDTPPVVTLPPPTVVSVAPTVPVVADREVTWGRWQPVYDQKANATLALAGSDRIAFNETYVLFRSQDGATYVSPQQGTVGFSMTGGEAYVRDSTTQVKTAATMENGQLMFNFGTATFTTSVDVLQTGARYVMASSGTVTKDGLFNSINQYQVSNNMTVNGALSNNAATYIFEGVPVDKKIVSGVTTWTK